MITLGKLIVDKERVFLRQLTVILCLLFILSLGYLAYGNYKTGSEPWQMVISSIMLSIPLLLMYFSIGVLITARQQKQNHGQIDNRLAKFIYWTPRISGILIILFVGMFSLDVFSEGGNLWEMLGGFLIHSLPSILMAGVLVLAWRRDWLGFVVFLGAAIFFLRFLLRNPIEEIGVVLLVSGPMAVIALLFWVNWKWGKPKRQ